MRELKATANGVVKRPIERCFTQLADVERYPEWYPETVKRVTVLERDSQGRPLTVNTVLEATLGPVHRGFDLRLQLNTLRPTLVSLERVPDDRGDHEFLGIAWKLAAAGESETELQLDMTAFLDVPRFFPVGQIADEIANGFMRAAVSWLG